MKRRAALASLGAAALAGTAALAAEPDEPVGSKATKESKFGHWGVPQTTVEEWTASLGKEGFQFRFYGRRIEFTATVIETGEHPRVRIDGMKRDSFDTAFLHGDSDLTYLAKGDRVETHGLIVEQCYAVWRIWNYSTSRIDA